VLAARPQNTAKQTHELTISLVMEGVTIIFLFTRFNYRRGPRAALIRIHLQESSVVRGSPR
jgi:hypothetical protein